MHESLRDAMFNHPQNIVMIIAIWVPVIVWSIMIIGWMIQGDTDAALGLVALFTVLGIGFTAMTGDEGLIPVLAFVAYASLALFPLAKWLFARRELKEMDIEAVERAYQALGVAPTNPALKFRLAKAFYQRGLVDLAISVGSKSIGNLPLAAFPDEHRDLAGWQAYATEQPPIHYKCSKCGYGNLPGDVFCQRCGGPFLIAYAGRSWQTGDTMKKLLSLWVALLLIVFGTNYAFQQFEPNSAILITVCLIGVSAFALIRGFGLYERVA